LLLGAALLAAPAHAGSRERDLAELRARIAALDAELNEKQASRREARDALRDSERAISDANRGLAKLDAESRALARQTETLEARRSGLEKRLSAQQAALRRILVARYEGGAPGALRLVLSAENPAEVARKLYYVTRVSRASAQLVASLRGGLADLEDVRREIDARAARLAQVGREQRADRKRILAERRARRRVLATIADEIRHDRRQIKVLRADEARLARLVEEIGRVLATKPGAGYVRIEKVPELGAASGPFDALRGKLRLPTRGELTGRFGAPRGDTGMTLKGVFIRAPEGQPVRAIAAGQVVFADWMRGFGNLLIIDHGEKYLSVYANNESLLKQVGDTVASGEPVATVGATGGIEQSGLYFELRHLGKAFDPLTWVDLK
jgi:septal ring factor EnvC (AmiA/AmiB activator)